MSCQEVVELVTAYLDGSMSWREKRRFEKHLGACHWCARYIEQMRVTIRTVGRIDPESISPRARDELMVAFRDWHAGAQPLP